MPGKSTIMVTAPDLRKALKFVHSSDAQKGGALRAELSDMAVHLKQGHAELKLCIDGVAVPFLRCASGSAVPDPRSRRTCSS